MDKKVNNYFKYYGKPELDIVKSWLESSDLIKNFKVEKANTGKHDCLVTYEDGEFLVEVKIDEKSWFERTGNIGLDYLSSFKFKNDNNQLKSFWVEPKDLSAFLNSIDIQKKEKLFTCDAQIQLYYVRDCILKAYSNKKLQEKNFVSYLESNYKLRINDKKTYGINDDWQSAAYFVNPLTDNELIKCEIKNYNEFIDAIKK